MNKLVKPVRDLDPAARKKLEEVLETKVSDDQQIVLEPTESQPIPDWVNFYAGLSENEIDEIEQEILKPTTFRGLDD